MDEKRIYTVDGETIVLKRPSRRTISLHIDGKKYEVSDEEAGYLVEWLVSQIGQPPGSVSTTSKFRKSGKKRPCKIEGTVWGLIQAGLLKPGTVLTLTTAGKYRKAKVLTEGELEVAGHILNTPSGACRFVLERQCNGWKEWKIPDGRPLDALRQELRRRNNG